MPFDLVAFGEAAPGANGKLAGATSDTLYKIDGDDLMIKKGHNLLLGVGAFGESTLGRVKIQQPSLPQDIVVIKGALLAAVDPGLGYSDMFGRPMELVPNEKCNVEVVNATDEDALVTLILGSAPIPQALLDAVRPTHRITGFADTTATAFGWTALSMTWNQSLPVGRYAVVGMKYGFFKTTPAMTSCARLLFGEEHSAGWRPGVLGVQLAADHEEWQGDPGAYRGVHWPEMPQINFPHDNLPGVEVCSAEAHTDQEIELLLKKIE